MVAISLSPESEVGNAFSYLWSGRPLFENYWQAFEEANLGPYFLNSLKVSIAATISAVLLDAFAGYSLAKLRFPGREHIFFGILLTTMIPLQVTIVPLFLLFRMTPLMGGNDLFGQGGTGLLNTYWALILPFAASAFGTYLMRDAFRRIPEELIEAARLDGASEWTIFWRICLPLTKPALTTVAMLSFTYSWNEFMLPLIMTDSPKLRTVQLGLSNYRGQYFDDWSLLMAATFLVSIPVVIVFVFCQKYFVQGVASSGMK
jgi:multiple sugar transport system permease protein